MPRSEIRVHGGSEDTTHARDTQTPRSLAEARGAGNEPPVASAAFDFCVVIPTWEESDTIAAAVTHLRRFAESCDIVVADGGSRDETRARARDAGARVVLAPRGRGPQMNAGARAGRAPILLFLHADCRLPANAFEAARDVLRRGHDAGVFRIRYSTPHPLLRIVAALSRFETPWSSFGESGLFVRREVFEAVGGFPDWPLFEDVEILARLRRRGKLGRASGTVLASARRYVERGVWRQQWRNGVLLVLFRLGVPPATLYRRYGEVRDPGRSFKL